MLLFSCPNFRKRAAVKGEARTNAVFFHTKSKLKTGGTKQWQKPDLIFHGT
jgi:hypothetical protein